MSVSRRQFIETSVAASALFAAPALGSRPQKVLSARDFPLDDSFSDRSRKVLLMTCDEAQRMNDWYQGSEHLLLALFAESEMSQTNWLEDLGINYEEVQCVASYIVGNGRGQETSETIVFSDNLHTCLDNAIFAARESGHSKVQPEHLMIGIIESFGTTANLLLQEMWMERGSVRLVAETSLNC